MTNPKIVLFFLTFSLLFYATANSGDSTPKLEGKFVLIQAKNKTFQMGSPASESHRRANEHRHKVTFSQDFEMGITLVTQLQWFNVMNSHPNPALRNPSEYKSKKDCPKDFRVEKYKNQSFPMCPKNPVENISWNDVTGKDGFLERLNKSKDGYTYRLPTEAEWEFAARGGKNTAYFFGNDPKELKKYAWFKNNSGGQTQAVDDPRVSANPFGLRDMAGNLWQWMQDRHSIKDQKLSGLNPKEISKPKHVLRGGSFGSEAQYLRHAFRTGFPPHTSSSARGFRLVRTQ